jgi:hypothetical protein
MPYETIPGEAHLNEPHEAETDNHLDASATEES